MMSTPPDRIASTETKTLLETSRFRVVQTSFQTGDGEVRTQDAIRHPGAIAIIPMVNENHVCLIKNRRVVVGESLIELPAGTLEEGEDPHDAALRELREETGYEAQQLELLHTFYMSPGVLDEKMHLYLATGLTEGEPAREEAEQIINLVLAWDDALALVFDQQIHDAKTMIGLLYYDHLRGGR